MKHMQQLLASAVFAGMMMLGACGDKKKEIKNETVDPSKTTTAVAASTAVKVDEGIVAYAKTSGVSGNLNSIGSDTMNNLMTFWAEAFKKFYPSVNVQIEGKGSSTAPPALIEGTAQLGPMSRPMKKEEEDKFEKKYGYKPTGIATSYDGLAVYVHKDNPIKGLTLQQVDAIFSKTRKGGAKEDVVTWGQLGLEGEWKDKPISLYGRNSASGTYGYFKDHALFKGDFKDQVKEQPGSASVVQGVGSDKYAIGYSGIGYTTSEVRAIPVAKDDKSEFVGESYENVKTGKYPLSRYLYVYVAKHPTKDMDPLTKEFLKFILSKEGQEVVVKDGYMPLTADVVKQQLELVEKKK
ncbi:MAG TPA: phosphate ABC transporter substrate-binding protein [bacterium]|nr:phosphate ABC transporter substrate-binding protein [bacterium]